MSNNTKTFSVTNRSGGTIGYTIPDLNVNRYFAIGETKKNISLEELEKLSYTRGGKRLLQHCLQLTPEGVEALELDVEQEYFLNEEEIKDLLLNGSLDAFLDCLDFAPEGVIEIIKKLAVSLPASDMSKLDAIKDKTGFDAFSAIRNNKMLNEESAVPASQKQRRVKETVETAPARRTTSEYKIVTKEN